MDQKKLDEVKRFLSVIFRPGEFTCFSKHPEGTTIFPVDQPPAWAQFFSINPIDGQVDRNPTKEYHSPDRPRRADDNVTGFRNILIECDKLAVGEQINYIDSFQVPWSTCTYSGGKSLHFLIALEEPFTTKEEYDHAVAWLHAILKEIDHTAKNCSRLSRFPNVIRIDKGVEQSLISVRARIPREKLLAWLGTFAELEPVKYDRASEWLQLPEGELGYMSKNTRDYLNNGAEPGERNNALYKAARDLLQQGWAIENAMPLLLGPLKETLDYDEELSIHTIESAFGKPAKHAPRLKTTSKI